MQPMQENGDSICMPSQFCGMKGIFELTTGPHLTQAMHTEHYSVYTPTILKCNQHLVTMSPSAFRCDLSTIYYPLIIRDHGSISSLLYCKRFQHSWIGMGVTYPVLPNKLIQMVPLTQLGYLSLCFQGAASAKSTSAFNWMAEVVHFKVNSQKIQKLGIASGFAHTIYQSLKSVLEKR